MTTPQEGTGTCCGEWTGKEAYDCDRDSARTLPGVCNCPCHSPKEDMCPVHYACSQGCDARKPIFAKEEVQESRWVCDDPATQQFLDAMPGNVPQESTEGDSWEEDFDRMWPNQTKTRTDLMGLFGNEYKTATATEAAILALAENKRQYFKDWIREKKVLWEKESYVKGQDHAFHGEIQNMKSITIKSTLEVPEALRELFRKEARTLALREAARTVRSKKTAAPYFGNEPTKGNIKLEDAAREIEEKI